MASVYFHIPFCKSRCSYCDFYSTTNIAVMNGFSRYLIEEMEMRKHFIHDAFIDSVYFGGGTPSLLSTNDIELLLSAVRSNFKISTSTEITLEANPEDVDQRFISGVKDLGINRISLGIQTFNPFVLSQMQRRHNVSTSINAICELKKIGISNISIDLIYGWPGTVLEDLISDLKKAIDLNIQHISAYHLTYHQNTKLFKLLSSGAIKEIEEDLSFTLYCKMIDLLEDAGYAQYEISNFALNGFQSRHNMAYWNQVEYLGLGPSAHSYNKKLRYWNISNIHKYINVLKEKNEPGESELLTPNDCFNDYIITNLRLVKGIDLEYIKIVFGNIYYEHVLNIVSKLKESGYLCIDRKGIQLTRKGMFVSDGIMESLIYV